MRCCRRLQLLFVIGISVYGLSARADVINGRWVEIPHCPNTGPEGKAGFDCAAPGFPWVESQHAILTHTGNLLLWKSTINAGGVAVETYHHAHYWDPVTNVTTNLLSTGSEASASDANCGGHTALADGRILIVGGWDRTITEPELGDPAGIKNAWIFDPLETSLQFVPQAPMALARWYPSPAILPDGRVVTIGGAEHWQETSQDWDIAEHPEMFSKYDSSWIELDNVDDKTDLHLYTFIHLLPGPGANVISIGPGMTDHGKDRAQKNVFKLGDLDQASANWSEITSPSDMTLRGGSHIRYEKDKILKSGGLQEEALGEVAVAGAEKITLDVNTGSVTSIAATDDMIAARSEHNLTVLPDGTVLATGGYSEEGESEAETDISEAVYTTELWDPATGDWRAVAPMTHRPPPRRSTNDTGSSIAAGAATDRTPRGTAPLRASMPSESLVVALFVPPWTLDGLRHPPRRPARVGSCPIPRERCAAGCAFQSLARPAHSQVRQSRA